MDLPREDGIYIHDTVWRGISVDGPFVPEEDGIYVLYFRNSKCPGCKAFDETWSRFVEGVRDLYRFVVVQCTEFFTNCSSGDAVDTFLFYLVFETPQIVVIVVKDGMIIYLEREIGSLTYNRLREFVINIEERMNDYLKRDEEVDSNEEGLYIDFSERNWKEIVRRIKALLDGRELREVCDEDGCRLVIV
ncbi:MAG: hypothetical protein QXJ56_00860 [Ignisphaera sp.]|uniref:Thioredoxin n=1 Tax=Ignisphaera aggregans TaxID=334771 RepID=A0A7J3I6S0_9CREN